MATNGSSGSALYTIEMDDRELRHWLNEMANSAVLEAVDKRMDKRVRETANTIARGAPVDTGRLKSTLWASRSIKKEGLGAYMMKNYTAYGIRQNFEHQRGNRYYMTNPIEDLDATFLSDVLEAIEEAIK